MMTPDPHTTHPSGSPQASQSEQSEEQSTVQSQTRDAMEHARNELRSFGEQARRQAVEARDQAKTQGRELITERKNRLAGEFHRVSDAVRRASEELRREDDSGYLARYADGLADTTDRAANYLSSHDIEDFAAEAQKFTRRHPEIVFGGLFIAGLAVARILKASMPEPQRPARQVNKGSTYLYSEGYAVGKGEAATTYQASEKYPVTTPGRV